uniref:Uncharacterized protein n=1 Tax=Electrophorus electricus TaxID=8005 RepID=A0AAY5ET50_ELEEL
KWYSEHSFSLSTISPVGKLEQLEYAVAAGAPSVGIKVSNGVVLSVHKVEHITKHIGMVYIGMGPDYRYAIFKCSQNNFCV